MYNKFQDLINLTPQNKLYSVVVIITVIFMCYLFTVDIYTIFITKGYYKDNMLYMSIEYNDIPKVNDAVVMSINNDKVKFTINNISEIKLDEYNLVNYQDYIIDLDKQYKNNELLDIKMYYNKERVYEKLLGKIIWKEYDENIISIWIKPNKRWY